MISQIDRKPEPHKTNMKSRQNWRGWGDGKSAAAAENLTSVGALGGGSASARYARRFC
ncbi:MAG: hypothetical protein ABJA82_02540 [Myxococcales bacterium]